MAPCKLVPWSLPLVIRKTCQTGLGWYGHEAPEAAYRQIAATHELLEPHSTPGTRPDLIADSRATITCEARHPSRYPATRRASWQGPCQPAAPPAIHSARMRQGARDPNARPLAPQWPGPSPCVLSCASTATSGPVQVDGSGQKLCVYEDECTKGRSDTCPGRPCSSEVVSYGEATARGYTRAAMEPLEPRAMASF